MGYEHVPTGILYFSEYPHLKLKKDIPLFSMILATTLALISGTLHILAEYAGRPWHVYLLKPFTTWTIILVAVLGQLGAPSLYQYMIIAGLVFSLAGDVFLMMPQDRFIPGLFSFLVAHLFYITAFTSFDGIQGQLQVIAPFLLVGIVVLALLWSGLGKMKLYVVAYMLVLLVMGWQATERWLTMGTTSALLAAIGAVLFIISDSVLAFNRFRKPFAAANAVILSTYYVAQLLIAWSVR